MSSISRTSSYTFLKEEELSLSFYEWYDSSFPSSPYSQSPPFSCSPPTLSIHNKTSSMLDSRSPEKKEREKEMEEWMNQHTSCFRPSRSMFSLWRDYLRHLAQRTFRHSCYIPKKMCQILSQQFNLPLSFFLSHSAYAWNLESLLLHPEWTPERWKEWKQTCPSEYYRWKRYAQKKPSLCENKNTRFYKIQSTCFPNQSLWSYAHFPFEYEKKRHSSFLINHDSYDNWQIQFIRLEDTFRTKRTLRSSFLDLMYHPDFPLALVWTYPTAPWDFSFLLKYRKWSIHELSELTRSQKISFTLFSQNVFLQPYHLYEFLGKSWDWKVLALHPNFPPQRIWEDRLLFPHWKWKMTFRHPRLDFYFWKTTLRPHLHMSTTSSLLFSNLFQYSTELRTVSFFRIISWWRECRRRQRLSHHRRFLIHCSHQLPSELLTVVLSFVSSISP